MLIVVNILTFYSIPDQTTYDSIIQIVFKKISKKWLGYYISETPMPVSKPNKILCILVAQGASKLHRFKDGGWKKIVVFTEFFVEL